MANTLHGVISGTDLVYMMHTSLVLNMDSMQIFVNQLTLLKGLKQNHQFLAKCFVYDGLVSLVDKQNRL